MDGRIVPGGSEPTSQPWSPRRRGA